MGRVSSYVGIAKYARPIAAALSSMCASLLIAASVSAQSNDQSKLTDFMPLDSFPASLQTAPAILLDLGRFNETPYLSLSPTLDQALVALMPQNLSGADITRNFSAIDCIAGQTLCGSRIDNVGFKLTKAINPDTPGGIDFQLIPRASLSFGDEHSSALVGAVVKIGEDLRDLDPNDTNRWYLFAGADAEALTYSSKSPSRLTRGQFNLQDKIIVGDAQAGFGYKIGDADISLAYIRRDVNSYGLEPGDAAISYTEDAAAISFTWRR